MRVAGILCLMILVPYSLTAQEVPAPPPQTETADDSLIWFIVRQIEGINEGVFFFQDPRIVFEVGLFDDDIHTLRAELGFHFWKSSNPDDPYSIGVGCWQNQSAMSLNLEGRTHPLDQRLYMMARYDLGQRGSIKGFVPFSNTNEANVNLYPLIWFDDIRYRLNDRLSIVGRASYDFNPDAGLSGDIGISWRSGSFEVQLLSDGFSVGWGF